MIPYSMEYLKRRIVIYARVSTDHDAQLSALENQIDWYKPILELHPEWTLVGQYIDIKTPRLIQKCSINGSKSI